MISHSSLVFGAESRQSACFWQPVFYQMQARESHSEAWGNILEEPLWEKILNFFFKWHIMVYFIFLSVDEAP